MTFFLQKWKCSWSLLATVASVVALISVAHLFLFPLAPSLEYFSMGQGQKTCTPINASIRGVDHDGKNLQPSLDLDHRFPADSHKSVVYRGAPWKAEIGRWFSGCDSIAAEVSIIEVFSYLFCLNWFSFNGVFSSIGTI